MNPSFQQSSLQRVKVLTESEIQQRLYGKYLGRKENKVVPRVDVQLRPVSQAAVVTTNVTSLEDEPEWTGAEILAGELKSLREELISLRQEREMLERRLKQRSQVSEGSIPPPAPKLLSTPLEFGAWRLIGKVFGVAALLAAVAYPLGMRILVASPPGIADPSPYTVQVAVYDVKSLAQRSLDYLQGLGYHAFLMDIPRRDGRPRYRIYVGRFVTKEEAQMEQARLTADPRFTDSFVRFQ